MTASLTDQAVIYTRGRVEGDALTRALIDAVSKGLKIPCNDISTGGLWLSEDPGQRAEAVKRCRPCPVLSECREVGQHQSWGVWGGRDFSKRPGKKKT